MILRKLHDIGLACIAHIAGPMGLARIYTSDGFNDLPFLQLMAPVLTSVRILQIEVARIAGGKMLKKMTVFAEPVPKN
ncbi:MAG: hypothetical protein P8M25_16615 [Paracoccaceae bacterium]|nr:hypothetical protein [Paracoccaceae bacterium]